MPRKTARRTPSLLAVTALTPVLLAGCFTSPDQADSRTGGDASTAADGERVSVAMLQPPRSALTPFSDDAFKLSRWSTAETLVVLDAAGDAEPALSTSWAQVDDLTWRFEVRRGVTFHDGTDLTVTSVVDALAAATVAAPKPRILDGVELAVEPDPAAPEEAVLVRTAVPDPLVPQRLSSPQLSILASSAYGEDGVVDPIGAGTGAFVLTGLDGTSSATLDRYDDYWGTPAAAAGIDVDFVPDGTARAAALRTGEADVVEAVPVSQAGLLDEDRVFEVPMPRTNTLYLNTETGAFTDPAVRAAAREVIDRQAIVETVYEGRADVAEGLLGPALPWAEDRPERTETAPGDPAGATITLGTFTDRAELPEVAVLLEQQLEAAGFQVEQVVREYSQIESDALAGTFDAFILSRATVLDSGDPVAYMYSDFACEGSFNIAQLCDPAVDEALTTAAAVPAGAERRAAILEAERRILETDAAIPMLHERVIQGEAAAVDGAARDPRERLLITPGTSVEQ